jgi:hypothetical protein
MLTCLAGEHVDLWALLRGGGKLCASLISWYSDLHVRYPRRRRRAAHCGRPHAGYLTGGAPATVAVRSALRGAVLGVPAAAVGALRLGGRWCAAAVVVLVRVTPALAVFVAPVVVPAQELEGSRRGGRLDWGDGPSVRAVPVCLGPAPACASLGLWHLGVRASPAAAATGLDVGTLLRAVAVPAAVTPRRRRNRDRGSGDQLQALPGSLFVLVSVVMGVVVRDRQR